MAAPEDMSMLDDRFIPLLSGMVWFVWDSLFARMLLNASMQFSLKASALDGEDGMSRLSDAMELRGTASVDATGLILCWFGTREAKETCLAAVGCCSTEMPSVLNKSLGEMNFG